MASIFGLPIKVFICIMGFMITALSITGVYVWWRKRAARRRRVSRLGAAQATETRKRPRAGVWRAPAFSFGLMRQVEVGGGGANSPRNEKPSVQPDASRQGHAPMRRPLVPMTC